VSKTSSKENVYVYYAGFSSHRRIPFNLICAVLLFVAASQAAQADELAVWNFNDSNLNVDHGSGTLTTTSTRAMSVCGRNNQQRRQGDLPGRRFHYKVEPVTRTTDGTSPSMSAPSVFEYRREFCDAGNQHRIQQ
jgi:hypothetical protein